MKILNTSSSLPGRFFPFGKQAMIRRIVPLACLLVVLFPHDAPAQKSPKVEDVYRESCASCHGVKLEGGSGGALSDGVWKHGATDEKIATAISEGLPDLGMPSFKEALSPEQIRSLVVYIRENEKSPAASAPPALPGGEVKTERVNYKVEPVVVQGLQTPWALVFLPDGRMLVTERTGRLRIVDATGNLQSDPVEGTPAVVANGQGGLLDVAPAPDFKSSGWIYLAYSAPAPGEPADSKMSMTKLIRGKLTGNHWTDEQTIFEAAPSDYSKAGVHFGSRIVFSNGFVFLSIGDRGAREKAQNLEVPNGKILRLLPDGGIPEDNPFAGRSDALEAVWSYGHRNPQGLALDPRDGSLYETEHGPRGGDEFNLLRKGANYGWPITSFGMNYDGTPVTAITEKEGIQSPLAHWIPCIAPSGLAFYDGNKFPGWKNDFFAGGLRDKGAIRRIRVENGKVIENETVLKGLGRVRDVRCGPDGFLYVVLNSPDRIIRLVPAGSIGE